MGLEKKKAGWLAKNGTYHQCKRNAINRVRLVLLTPHTYHLSVSGGWVDGEEWGRVLVGEVTQQWGSEL